MIEKSHICMMSDGGTGYVAILKWLQTEIRKERVISRFSRAVTLWMADTESGRNVTKVGYDFQVSDLADYYKDKELIPYLEAEDIHGLSIDCFVAPCGNWDYDERLYDADFLPDVEEQE